VEALVERRPLGRSGLLVSTYALGTMTFGEVTATDDAHRILDRYLGAGGNLLDVADVYAAGESERVVGTWLASRGTRDDVVLATKARFPVGDDHDVNRRGLSRRWLTRAIDRSLERLGVDHVDLYQVHAWDPLVPVEEWLGVLDGLVRAGKIGAVGVSNLRGYQLQRAVDVARAEGFAPVVSLQPQYNLLSREIEWELVPCCTDEGIAILPWSPLGGGWLTGKYRRDRQPPSTSRVGEDPDRGVEAWDQRATAHTWAVLEVLDEVAAEHGAEPAQVALAWVTARPGVTSTIIGVRTLDQLEIDLGAVGLELDEVAVARLDDVSAPPTPAYPYALLDEIDARRRRDLARRPRASP
jgi:aryl-alcohol dehydrogenase-like predicted oxidoreductase